MKWSNNIEISCSIDRVWEVLNEERYLQLIKPQVVESQLLPERTRGSLRVYRETYREGKREETYELTVRTVVDEVVEKEQIFDFVIAQMIASQGRFHLLATDDRTTLCTYSGTNTGVSFLGKIMLAIFSIMSSDKMTREFLQRVKSVSESER